MPPRSATRPTPPDIVLRLYVCGATPASARAVVNTRRVCEDRLHGRYSLEILDIAENVRQATHDQVIAAPTLLRLLPLPLRRLIGDMSNTQAVIDALHLPEPT